MNGTRRRAGNLGSLENDLGIQPHDLGWGERTRLACGFGRRARNRVGQISWLTGFRRDAENGNRDGRAPHSNRRRRREEALIEN